MSGRFTDAEVSELAREIKEYLKLHRSMADTLEGLLTRWQVATGGCVEQSRFELALKKLCQQGVLRTRQVSGGATLYLPQNEN